MRMHLDIYTKRSSHVISHVENEANIMMQLVVPFIDSKNHKATS